MGSVEEKMKTKGPHTLFEEMKLLKEIQDHSGQNIRKLVKDGFIIRKPTKIHSHSRARRMKEAKRKGRCY